MQIIALGEMDIQKNIRLLIKFQPVLLYKAVIIISHKIKLVIYLLIPENLKLF